MIGPGPDYFWSNEWSQSHFYFGPCTGPMPQPARALSEAQEHHQKQEQISQLPKKRRTSLAARRPHMTLEPKASQHSPRWPPPATTLWPESPFCTWNTTQKDKLLPLHPTPVHAASRKNVATDRMEKQTDASSHPHPSRALCGQNELAQGTGA